MKKFSVLLLYPTYLDGTQTYLAHVTAENVSEAIRLAQTMAANENGCDKDASDFRTLLVTEGHIKDLFF